MRETPEYTYCCDFCGMDHPTDAHINVYNPAPCYICGGDTGVSYDELEGDEYLTCDRTDCNAKMALLVAESQMDDRPVARYEPDESFYAGLRELGY